LVSLSAQDMIFTRGREKWRDGGRGGKEKKKKKKSCAC